MPNDIQAIKNLIFSYAELLDTGDLEGLGQLFERATLRTHGHERLLRGAKAVRQMIESSVHLYNGIPSTKHLITNLSVEVDTDRGAARARSYYTAFQVRPELPLQPILAGRWHDRFELEGNRWCFTERVIYPDLFGDVRFHIRSV